MPAQDIVVKAVYIEDSSDNHTLTFVIDGKEVSSSIVKAGTPITAPEGPAKEGYSFEWKDLPEIMPEHDLTVEGVYTVNSYTLTFKADDDVIKTESLEYGATIVAPAEPEKEGYTFSGWGSFPETMPAHDLEVKGSYTINTYKVTFLIDSVEFHAMELEYGATIVAPEVVAPEGYTFSGWDEVPATMPAHDLEINGTYTANIYKAVFMVDGKEYKTLEVAYGTTIEAPEAPEKEGYTFDKWEGLEDTMPAHDIEVTAVYTANIYKAVFMVDGEEYKTLDVAYGAAIEAPEAPEKEGYTFDKWEGLEKTMPAHDIEVTAVYTPNIYKAVFMVDGEEYKTLDVAYGAAIEAPEAPEKEGYTFDKWEGLEKTMPAHDIEVTAVYTANIYKAVFMVDGEAYKTLDVAYGAAIEAPEAPEKEGYTFDNWVGLEKTMPAHDIEVTAVYTANTYKAVFMVDGEAYKTLEVAYGAAIEAPEAPEKEGYTFDKWEGLETIMPAHDIEVTAVYTANIYKAVFKIDGETIATLDVPYGAAIETPAVTEKEGYTFGGWDNLPEAMP
ncbi:MAG: InlB B-repeat-containing protein, partial [Muribaculaceae bacterium]|nr:InlB B-repeat-containing protein [Muribaculaceae bacterium]